MDYSTRKVFPIAVQVFQMLIGGGDLDDRKLTSGYVFQIEETAISWRSKKQTCVDLSTAEAEYVALSSSAQESLWLLQLFADLTKKPTKPWLFMKTTNLQSLWQKILNFTVDQSTSILNTIS